MPEAWRMSPSPSWVTPQWDWPPAEPNRNAICWPPGTRRGLFRIPRVPPGYPIPEASMRFPFSRLLLASLPSLAPHARIAAQVYQNPIPAIARILDAPALPAVLPSLDGSKLLLMERPGLPSIAQLTGPE